MSIISLQRRLVDAREATGMSQSEVARKLHLNNSIISRIESGDRKLGATELAKLADLYAVSVDYLLGRSNQKNPHQNTGSSDTTDLSGFLADTGSAHLTFKGKMLSPEQTMKLRIALTQIFWDELALPQR